MRGRCTATNKDGEQCQVEGHLVDPETGLCATHADPERFREVQRKGGKAVQESWARKGLDDDELPPLDSYAAAKAWLELVGRAVATGRLKDRDGSVIVRSVQEWTRAHGDELTSQVVSKLKARIEELESELKRAKVRAVR